MLLLLLLHTGVVLFRLKNPLKMIFEKGCSKFAHACAFCFSTKKLLWNNALKKIPLVRLFYWVPFHYTKCWQIRFCCQYFGFLEIRSSNKWVLDFNLKSPQNVIIALEYTLFVFVKHLSWANQNPWSPTWTPNKYSSASPNCHTVFFVHVFRQKNKRFSRSVKKERVCNQMSNYFRKIVFPSTSDYLAMVNCCTRGVS